MTRGAPQLTLHYHMPTLSVLTEEQRAVPAFDSLPPPPACVFWRSIRRAIAFKPDAHRTDIEEQQEE